MKNILNKNLLLTTYSLLIPVAIALSLLIIAGSPKQIAATILLMASWLFSTHISVIGRIFVLLLIISFPITIQIGGKDAVTSGMIAVVVLSLWNLAVNRRRDSLFKLGKDVFVERLLLAVSFVALVGVMSGTPSGYMGPALRNLARLITSIMIFWLLLRVPYPGFSYTSQSEYIDKLIAFMISIVCIQILIGLVIFISPEMQEYFTIFFHRTQETIRGIRINSENQVTRIASLVFGAETIGEIVAVCFPLAYYMVSTRSGRMRMFYSAAMLWMLLGLGLSGTRSGIALLLFGIVMLIVGRIKWRHKKKIFQFIFIAIISIVIINFFAPDRTFNSMTQRSLQAIDLIRMGESLETIANRTYAWSFATDITFSTLSAFGHGPTQPLTFDMSPINFHCLYLTLLFQFGYIGTFLYLLFFSVIIFGLLKQVRKGSNAKIRLLGYCCLISLISFLINEIKYEFNRGDSYQQLLYALFVIHYLASTVTERENLNEATKSKQIIA